jgi:hypothetical protein
VAAFDERRRTSYFLKYVNAAIANKTIAVIQSDESLNPVFFAMTQILKP